MIGVAVILAFGAGAAALAGPLAWSDRAGKGPLFQAALSLFCALIAFGAAAAQLAAPGAANLAGPVEIAGMALAGAFIFNALALVAAPKARAGAAAFAGALGLALAAAVSAPLLGVRAGGWDAMAAIYWAGCTLAGLWRARTAFRRSEMRAAHRPAIALACAYCVVHAAQILRMVWDGPGAPMLLLAASGAALAGLLAFLSGLLAARLGEAPARYAKSGHSEADAAALFAEIEAMMARERPFTDPGFDRDALADRLGRDPREVGEALNRAGGLSAPAYFRAWRVREAERLLALPENAGVSLDALALEAGFRSRSRFYAAFEEAFGMSPGARRAKTKAAAS